jgi:hypothetical protein
VAVRGECALPGFGVQIVAVDQRAVDVENRDL